MNWLILIVAGLFEVVWAVALKMSNGFKNITVVVVQTRLHGIPRRSKRGLATLNISGVSSVQRQMSTRSTSLDTTRCPW